MPKSLVVSRRSMTRRCILPLLLLWGCAQAATAAELSVWSAGATKPPMEELVSRFQASTGHKLSVDYAPVGVLLRRLAAGGRPDVLLVSAEVVAEVERQNWAVVGSAVPVGSVGIGVAVKAGATQPDISSPEALRQTLLNAQSITYMDPQKGTSGKHFAAVLEQLGIASQMQAKTKLGDVGFVVEPVAKGEIEIGIQQITEILPVQGAVLVGPLPGGLQKITTYSALLGTGAQAQPAAAEFIRYLQTPQAIGVFERTGFKRP
jgi:molybdate transport system substrate-binding protein